MNQQREEGKGKGMVQVGVICRECGLEFGHVLATTSSRIVHVLRCLFLLLLSLLVIALGVWLFSNERLFVETSDIFIVVMVRAGGLLIVAMALYVFISVSHERLHLKQIPKCCPSCKSERFVRLNSPLGMEVKREWEEREQTSTG